MVGVITEAEVRANSEIIISEWGQDFYDACLEAHEITFLELLVQWNKL